MTSTDPYVLVAKLGEGGMAEVFKAVKQGPEGWQKPIALKRILPHLADKPAFIQMLSAEARLHAHLDHPNLVQIIDFFEHGHTYIIAMEYVAGHNLRKIAHVSQKRGLPMPWQGTLHIIAEMLKGLDYAHKRKGPDGPLQIVHRDISPQNILVSFEGIVKLSDFGIAWANIEREQTESGVLKGKHRYLSPEQLESKPVDFHADLFSSGVVLYELLCNMHPFDTGNDFETMRRIVSCQHRPSHELLKEIPDSIHHTIEVALHKIPQERFKDAASFREALLQDQEPTWLAHGTELISKWLNEVFPKGAEDLEVPIEATPILTKSGTPLSIINPTNSIISGVASLDSNVLPESGTLGSIANLLQKARDKRKWIVGICFSLAFFFVLIALLFPSQRIDKAVQETIERKTIKTEKPIIQKPKNRSTPKLSKPTEVLKKESIVKKPKITLKKEPPRTPIKKTKKAVTKPPKKPQYGMLTIKGPQKAAVFINGNPVGILPLKPRTLQAGRKYMVLIAPKGLPAVMSRVVIQAKKNSTVRWTERKETP